MNNTRFVGILAGVLLILAACSDTETPTKVTNNIEKPGFELRPEYYYMHLDDVITLETSPDYLAIKFSDGLTSCEIERFLNKWDLEIEHDQSTHYDLYILATHDAFSLAPLLSQQPRHVEYVGPVFVTAECNGEPLMMTIRNRIAVLGDTENEEVVRLLSENNATLIEVYDFGSIYSLPWGDPAKVFDLANELHQHPAIEYATPSFIGQLCFSAERSQAWVSIRQPPN